MKVRYVEAMIEERARGDAAPFRTVNLDNIFAPLRKLLAENTDATAALDEATDLLDSKIEAMEEAFDEASAPTDAPLIPVGSSESIMAQLQRAGFLNCEEVVIVRLSDFKTMLGVLEEDVEATVA